MTPRPDRSRPDQPGPDQPRPDRPGWDQPGPDPRRPDPRGWDRPGPDQAQHRLPPELRDQTASALAQVVSGRPAYPGAPATAPSFDDEIAAAVRYEKGLAVKALLALALVAVVLALRVAFFG